MQSGKRIAAVCCVCTRAQGGAAGDTKSRVFNFGADSELSLRILENGPVDGTKPA